MRRFQSVALLLLVLSVSNAFSQAYPVKPVRIIVPIGPGSGPDARARQLASKFPEFLGQPLVVENKAGAGGVLAGEAVARAPADGYTLLLGNAATHVFIPLLFLKPPYRADEDFVPITSLSKGYWVMAVNASVPVRNFSELLQLAKSQPGALRYASTGEGTYAHLLMESIRLTRGIEFTQIPYKTAASEVPDLLGGRIDIALDSHVVFAPLILSGKLKGLAVAGPRRIDSLPGVPTLSEAGGPNLDINVWQGVFAPTGTPAAILRRLHVEITRIMNLPEIRNPIIEGGYEMGGESAEEFAAFIRVQRAMWGKVIKEVNVQPR
jgi:tripartite-type tricarboxylate transporter receptor subunit TctC